MPTWRSALQPAGRPALPVSLGDFDLLAGEVLVDFAVEGLHLLYALGDSGLVVELRFGSRSDAGRSQLLGELLLGQMLGRALDVQSQSEVGVAVAVGAQLAASAIALELLEAQGACVGALRVFDVLELQPVGVNGEVGAETHVVSCCVPVVGAGVPTIANVGQLWATQRRE